ncbi:MAG: glycosyltransferase [bacterium]|nr:glycosyltransferase [Candidatus Colisoma equi]
MVKFSVILPTYNRAFCICRAVDSLLAQTFRDWELVIVDDGSTDGTETLLREKYASQFACGQFRLVSQPNGGVSRARNRALAEAKGDWIAYLDSDNAVRPDWLESFADAIAGNSGTRTFYSKFRTMKGLDEKGEPFDWGRLLVRNTIDLGVFVHDRRLYEELGGFDESFRRLVDWELILRYTRRNAPVFVDRVLMDYNDSRSFARITGDWNDNQDWKAAVIAKHGGHLPLVTTAVIAYNHKFYIAAALDSALRQNGPFRREIVVSDDGSTDGTAEIVSEYARRYPHLIRNISEKANVGISKNVRRCLPGRRAISSRRWRATTTGRTMRSSRGRSAS